MGCLIEIKSLEKSTIYDLDITKRYILFVEELSIWVFATIHVDCYGTDERIWAPSNITGEYTFKYYAELPFEVLR